MVQALTWPCHEVLTAAALKECAVAAESRWGLAGVRVQFGTDDTATLLITPGTHLPAGHPLASGGLDAELAGLLALWGTTVRPDGPIGRWLLYGLAARLAGRCPALEAQASAFGRGGALAPPAPWLTAVGFRSLGFPPLRFRYELGAALPAEAPPWPGWLIPKLWRRPQPASATVGTSSRTGPTTPGT
jgi:hypothetical protein